MRLLLLSCGLLALFVVTFSCKNGSDQPSKPDFLSANLDTTVSPAEDFFQYANGGWIKRNPIPEEESQWGVGDLVQEDIYLRLRKINEDAVTKNPAAGSIEQKIADFWTSGMDSAGIDKQGIEPLRPILASIDKVQTISDLVSLTGDFHNKRIQVLFADGVGQDDKNSELMAYQLSQGGLGMPNRDYYFNTDSRSVSVKAAYQVFARKTFEELGNDSIDAQKATTALLNLETKLAKASRKLVDLRDANRNYNKMGPEQVGKLAPNFDWATYTKMIGIAHLDSVIVGQPEFFTALNQEIRNTSINDWKNYFRFHLIRVSASYLDQKTFSNFFGYTQSLSGATRQRPRWKRVLDAEEGAMGEALGQLFVKEDFNEKAKKRYADLVEAIRDAFKERIQKLSWMGDSTKKKAIEKLRLITPKVGYPDQWKDFSALAISKDVYILNILRAREWWRHYYFNKLGKPVDRKEWGISPQTYNAFYSPNKNEILLPAGIFAVPGMMDADLDDAFVYGYAAASTIGHEITHGFDDQGRQYDLKGNLINWWTKEDSAEFVKRTGNIIREFNEFNPVDTLHVNGEATQGENIADLGGLLLGLDALKKSAAYQKNEKIGGFTPTQRYFLGYAYGWLYAEKKESLANQILTDEHAPAKERVNGPMMNIPEFYEAFGVKPGDKMYRPDSLRVSIW